jgi:hypothetical protein
MSRIIWLGGMLAILAAAGATTLAFITIKSEAVEQRAASGDPVDPAILTWHLRKLQEQMAFP